MDPIKEAFSRAKQDIQSLKDQFSVILVEIQDIKKALLEASNRQTDRPTHILSNTNNQTQESNTPTDKWSYKALKPHIYSFSTRSDGVPTDRQTDQQTDRPTHILQGINRLEEVSNILESLDTLKKDIRSKFKHLTNQEMLVFSTIYQLQEEGFNVDYSIVAQKLSLSESSIRDYVQKMIKKGISIQKTKENNKKVFLSISSEFKQIASLETILKLREI